jgi:hypothetical protein
MGCKGLWMIAPHLLHAACARAPQAPRAKKPSAAKAETDAARSSARPDAADAKQNDADDFAKRNGTEVELTATGSPTHVLGTAPPTAVPPPAADPAKKAAAAKAETDAARADAADAKGIVATHVAVLVPPGDPTKKWRSLPHPPEAANAASSAGCGENIPRSKARCRRNILTLVDW